ncbi:hypothetical protein V5O48_009453 [Marasmius crinis-equi]|uniref:Uncharacterized protein n=1 Tax=Marasmius crinis-equi TaxID=585013 RepID=A0ABR3FB97_9AGAR
MSAPPSRTSSQAPATTYESDSDLEEIPVVRFVLPTAGPLTDAKARQIIADMQRNNDKLRTRIKELGTKVADLKGSAIAVGRRRGRPPKAQPLRTLDVPRDTMIALGKKWCVMEGAWIPTNAFLRLPNTTMPNPHSHERFENQENYDTGTVVQLHLYLKEQKHRDLAAEEPEFRDEFIPQVNSERSTALSTVRTAATSIFMGYNIPGDLWSSTKWPARSQNEVLRSLLAPPEGAPRNSRFSRIFFPNGVYNMDFLFMNDVLPKVLRVILFNKNSIEPNARITGSQLLGNVWGVTRVTAPSVALSAMVVQFILNGDENLTPVGATTKTEYYRNYQDFHRLIVLSSNSSWASTLFRFFNERVFKGGASSFRSEGVEDEIDGALIQLNLGPSDGNPVPPAVADNTAASASGSNTLASNDPAPPSINAPAPQYIPVPRSVREAHPLFTDGTEILGGETLATRHPLPTPSFRPSLLGPPGPPPPSFPAGSQAEAEDTELDDTEPEITEQAAVNQTQSGGRGRGRGNTRKGVVQDRANIEAAPAPTTKAAPRPHPKGRGKAAQAEAEAEAVGGRNTRARASRQAAA